MIHFDKVTKKYDGCTALEEVSFTVKPKEFISIVGHSGAGKTTLLKMVLVEEHPSSGSVLFDSVNIHALKRHKLHKYRQKIGAIFQDFRLLPDKTTF